MKIEIQVRADLARVSKLIEGIPIAMLTNMDADRTLVSRPMSVLQMDAQGALWFFTDLHSAKTERLRSMNLTFSDIARATYVSLSGHGALHTDRSRIDALWSPATEAWFPAGAESPNLGLLQFVPAAVDYWDAPSCRMLRTFGVVAPLNAEGTTLPGERGTSRRGVLEGSASAPPRRDQMR